MGPAFFNNQILFSWRKQHLLKLCYTKSLWNLNIYWTKGEKETSKYRKKILIFLLYQITCKNFIIKSFLGTQSETIPSRAWIHAHKADAKNG